MDDHQTYQIGGALGDKIKDVTMETVEIPADCTINDTTLNTNTNTKEDDTVDVDKKEDQVFKNVVEVAEPTEVSDVLEVKKRVEMPNEEVNLTKETVLDEANFKVD